MPRIRTVLTSLGTPSLKNWICPALSWLAVLGKFWLIAKTEIVDDGDDPHEYVFQILYPHAGLAYPPGTGLVGWFFYEFGIPFRLGIEAAFIFASALALKALLASPTKSYLSLGLFIVMIFNPALVQLFSHLMSDQVWLVETMLGASFSVLALQNGTRPNLVYNGLAGFFLGLAVITRVVFIPTALALTSLIGLAALLLFFKRSHPGFRMALQVFALTVCTLLLGVGILYIGTRAYNYKFYGFHGVSVLDSDEYKTFYFYLQAVGKPDGDSYFPVDENRRKLIAQAGPASRRFMAEMETNAFYKNVGRYTFGKSDFPTGWIHFAIFNTALSETDGSLSASCDLFRTIEGEIREAGRAGRLQVNPILPLPDRRLHLVLGNYPGAMARAIQASLYEPTRDFLNWPQEPRRYDSHDFDRALDRRPASESPAREKARHFLGAVYAWVYTPFTFVLWLLSLTALLTVLARKWRRIPAFAPIFIARQLFTLFFMVYLLWYAFFGASGLFIFTRYMVYNNVMLPPLIAYYLATTYRLLREDLRAGSLA